MLPHALGLLHLSPAPVDQTPSTLNPFNDEGTLHPCVFHTALSTELVSIAPKVTHTAGPRGELYNIGNTGAKATLQNNLWTASRLTACCAR